MAWQDVITGEAKWSLDQADCLEWLAQLPPDSVDLCVWSPPYETARLYAEVQFKLRGQDWVDWMVKVFEGCRRVCKGMVCCVCQGQTRQYRWSATPALLMADLHRAGFNLRDPIYFHRVGIPGSGGPDDLRHDVEYIIRTTRPGKLPWSDPTACGHPPKWAPGGEMSHRLSDGTRVNHSCVGKKHTKAKADGDEEQVYFPPAKANPGNLLSIKVGGGQMGHPLAHMNEAPLVLSVCEFLVKTFCPPQQGIVLDCFSGSGTTAHAAIANGRRFVGCDVRQSQTDLGKRRVETVTPTMFP